MCQATGYKLKSNKELPSAFQVFSKLIPMTKNEVTNSNGTLTFKDTVNGNQLYPMYSILDFEHNASGSISAINVKMCRVAGIFKADGKDSFTQTSYGKNAPSIHYLIEVNSGNVDIINRILKYEGDNMIKPSTFMYGAWVPENEYFTPELDGAGINKYLYIQY